MKNLCFSLLLIATPLAASDEKVTLFDGLLPLDNTRGVSYVAPESDFNEVRSCFTTGDQAFVVDSLAIVMLSDKSSQTQFYDHISIVREADATLPYSGASHVDLWRAFADDSHVDQRNRNILVTYPMEVQVVLEAKTRYCAVFLSPPERHGGLFEAEPVNEIVDAVDFTVFYPLSFTSEQGFRVDSTATVRFRIFEEAGPVYPTGEISNISWALYGTHVPVNHDIYASHATREKNGKTFADITLSWVWDGASPEKWMWVRCDAWNGEMGRIRDPDRCINPLAVELRAPGSSRTHTWTTNPASGVRAFRIMASSGIPTYKTIYYDLDAGMDVGEAEGIVTMPEEPSPLPPPPPRPVSPPPVVTPPPPPVVTPPPPPVVTPPPPPVVTPPPSNSGQASPPVTLFVPKPGRIATFAGFNATLSSHGDAPTGNGEYFQVKVSFNQRPAENGQSIINALLVSNCARRVRVTGHATDYIATLQTVGCTGSVTLRMPDDRSFRSVSGRPFLGASPVTFEFD